MRKSQKHLDYPEKGKETVRQMILQSNLLKRKRRKKKRNELLKVKKEGSNL